MTTDGQHGQIFGAYNARQQEPEEVASTFVPSKKFWTLLEPNNSLLIGPRGSGKTTLLKMLQPSALDAWTHERAREAKTLTQFHGVFVPTDLNWKEEITVAVSALKEDERETLTEALFVANTQLALITTLVQLSTIVESGCFSRIPIEQEAAIVRSLERTWRLRSDELPLHSFRALRTALRGRVRRLSSFRPNMPDRAGAIDAIQREMRLAQFGFEATLLETVGIVEDVTLVKRKWALCFDEVELAPEFIQTAIFKRLRSPSSLLFYKLAVAPFVPAAELLNKADMPGVANDWTPIPLWYRDQSEAQRQEAQRFCYDLWQQIASKELGISYEPTLIFGQSELGDQATSKPLPGFKAASRYSKHGVWQQAFDELSKKDASFRDFLKRKDIDPKRLDEAPAKTRDSVIRKIAPIVYYRARFIRGYDSSGKPSLGTPQVHPELYSGWEAICAVCEGNPRWFKGIVDVLLKEWIANNRTLSRAFQARELQRASVRFRALVAACPVGDVFSGLDPDWGPIRLVEHIANFQREQLLRKPFSTDPPLSIELGEQEPRDVVQLVSVCLNIGALINMDDEDSAMSLHKLAGRRFRLSHLLAPSFVLPLRSGTARALSRILNQTKNSKFSTSFYGDGHSQGSLWNDQL